MAYNILQMMCSFTTKDFWFLLSPRLKTKPGSTDKTFQLCHRVNYFYPGTALVLITGDIKKLHLSGSKDKVFLLKDSTIPPVSLRARVTLQAATGFHRFLPLFLINTVIAI